MNGKREKEKKEKETSAVVTWLTSSLPERDVGAASVEGTSPIQEVNCPV